MKQTYLILAGVLVGILVFVGVSRLLPTKSYSLGGGASNLDTYQATSTRSGTGAAIASISVLSDGTQGTGGTLGAVTITGAGAGSYFFWDATTTNVNKRTGQIATSSLKVITIPASAATGTYTFKANFYTGMIMEIQGTAPTSTVTYLP